jgi:hypothetical protein
MNKHRIPKESLRVFRARFEDPDDEPIDDEDLEIDCCDDLEDAYYLECKENE